MPTPPDKLASSNRDPSSRPRDRAIAAREFSRPRHTAWILLTP